MVLWDSNNTLHRSTLFIRLNSLCHGLKFLSSAYSDVHQDPVQLAAAWDTELAYRFLGNALECAWVAVLSETWAALLKEIGEICFRQYVLILCGCAYFYISGKLFRSVRIIVQWLTNSQYWTGLASGESVLGHITAHLCRAPKRDYIGYQVRI